MQKIFKEIVVAVVVKYELKLCAIMIMVFAHFHEFSLQMCIMLATCLCVRTYVHLSVYMVLSYYELPKLELRNLVVILGAID